MGQGAEHQLGEAVARGVPLPHRERLQHTGLAQFGQEPLHGGFTCEESRGGREERVLPGWGIRVPNGEVPTGSRHPVGRSGDGDQEARLVGFSGP